MLAVQSQALTEYNELVAEGLTNHQILMARSYGASHATILLWAKMRKEKKERKENEQQQSNKEL